MQNSSITQKMKLVNPFLTSLEVVGTKKIELVTSGRNYDSVIKTLELDLSKTTPEIFVLALGSIDYGTGMQATAVETSFVLVWSHINHNDFTCGVPIFSGVSSAPGWKMFYRHAALTPSYSSSGQYIFQLSAIKFYNTDGTIWTPASGEENNYASYALYRVV